MAGAANCETCVLLYVGLIGISAMISALLSAGRSLVAPLLRLLLSGWLTRILRCLGVNAEVTRLFYLTRTMAPVLGLLSLLLRLSDLNLLSSSLLMLRLGVQVLLLRWHVLIRIRRVRDLLVNCLLSLWVTANAGDMTGLATFNLVLTFRVNAAPFVFSGFDSNSMLLLRSSKVICWFSLCTLLLAGMCIMMGRVVLVFRPCAMLVPFALVALTALPTFAFVAFALTLTLLPTLRTSRGYLVAAVLL